MSSSRWDDFDGMTRWREAPPPPVGHLYAVPSEDHSVSSMLMLSGSIPLQVHFQPPAENQAPPYVLVEPIGVPIREIRVTLVTAAGREERVVPWNPRHFPTRVAFGDVIRAFAATLKR